jgi:hypothetical protein
MRLVMLFPMAAVAVAAQAQAPLKVAAVSPASAPTSVRQMVADEEKRLDTKIALVGDKDPVYILGLTRGLYLPGYGAVFTEELDLIQSPRPNPFHQQMTDKEIATIHQRKLTNLTALRKAVRDMWADAAASLTGMPDTEQVVLAVRLLYQSWENTGGLPSQIVVKGPRKASPAAVTMEEQ